MPWDLGGLSGPASFLQWTLGRSLNTPAEASAPAATQLPQAASAQAAKMPQGFDYSPEGIKKQFAPFTSMFDLKRLATDLEAGKVKNAPGLADQLVSSGRTPGRTPMFSPGPSGFSESMGSVMPPLEDREPFKLPEARRAGPQEPLPGAGGRGVEVKPSQGGEEKQPRDWQSLLGVLGVGLTDFGNAIGNPRAPVGGAFYDLMKSKLQAQQMDQLKRRQSMWDDAYTQSQALPQEVLTDERFAGLSQAKAILDKDMEDGKIDNEKSVSNFLTEQARVKRDLEELGLDIKARQQAETEAKLANMRSEREAQETQRVQAILDNPTAYSPDEVRRAELLAAGRKQLYVEGGRQLYMTPTEKANWDVEQENLRLDRGFKEKQLGQQERLTNAQIAMQRDTRNAANQARQDAIEAAKSGRVGGFVQRSFQDAVKNRLGVMGDMEMMDEPTRNAAISSAYQAAAADIGPLLFSAAQQAGVKIDRGPNGEVLIDGLAFTDPVKANMHLLGMLGG